MKTGKNTLRMLAAFIISGMLATVSTACSDSGENVTPSGTTADIQQKIAIIDAGSTGSRLYVYQINNDSTIETVFPVTSEEEKASKGRAISTVANHPDSVKKFVASMTTGYTSATGEKIPLYIFATAGMRLQPQVTTEQLYKMIGEAKGSMNGYDFKNAMTISGRYEGLYAWIADNYENKHLTSSPRGIIESGGASIQITFPTQATDIPAAQKLTRNGWGTIYSKSYLGGGVSEMWAKTPQTEPFVFDIQLDDVSGYFGDTQFYGCGGIKYLLKGIKKYGSFEGYVQTLTNDPADTYHDYFGAYYLKWVFETLKLSDRVSLPEHTPNWTEGAAYDIVINKEAPEAFDYDKKY